MKLAVCYRHSGLFGAATADNAVKTRIQGIRRCAVNPAICSFKTQLVGQRLGERLYARLGRYRQDRPVSGDALLGAGVVPFRSWRARRHGCH